MWSCRQPAINHSELQVQ